LLWVCFFAGLKGFLSFASAQEYIYPDSLQLLVPEDTINTDTLRKQVKPTQEAGVLDAEVDYDATDSVMFDIVKQKVFMYGGGVVVYKDITLKADYIELDLKDKTVFAKGAPDSVGVIQGKPEFTEGKETFESNTLTYNFETKKGIISGIVTEQEGGYLHSGKTKKMEDGTINIAQGKYTTCDAPEPHFYLALTKAKVIPDDKIVSGPAYMVVEDIPLPLILPFGFFPNQKTKASGILIPEWGEEKNRGFYLRNGGYYFALNDYFDLALTTDIYSNGTWGVSVRSNYKVRYKFGGSVGLKYYNNVSGDLDIGNYVRKMDYAVNWSHSQDSKSSPSSSFSAQVNMSSSTFDKNQSYVEENYLTTTKQSSIAYTKRWEGTPFNFSGSLNHSQNSQNQTVNMSLPKMAFNMNRIYPFRKLSKNPGTSRWYQNIELSYRANMENKVNTYDTLLFTSAVFDDMDPGFKHEIPLTANFRPFNNFSIAPRIQYTGVLYNESIRKHWNPDYIDPETGEKDPKVVVDTITGVQYAHSFLPAISATFNPKIFGMYQFKNPDAKVVAIRHLMTPTFSFSYVPDMRGIAPNYYDTVQVDTTGRKQTYSYFDGRIYGTPSFNGRSGSVNFTLNNNVEMKVRTDSDSTTDYKKVKLLENLQFSTNYNIFADSLNLAPVNFSGYTTVYKGKFKFNFNGSFDPYAINEFGSKINTFEINQTGNLARLTRFSFGLDFTLASKQKKSGAENQTQNRDRMSAPGMQNEMMQEQQNLGIPESMYPGYVDFNIPWSFSVRYNFNYTKPGHVSKVTQTLNFNGNLSLTPKWKVSVTTGWDFVMKSISYTSLNIHRDLHCWEMRLSIVPFGRRQSYTFGINAKASILKDLKYEKRKNWRDY
jgi:hypothetical protein